MKKHFIILFFGLLMCIDLQGQDVQGQITYNRKTDWIKMNSQLPWMTSEDIDRDKLTWGNYESKGQDYELRFKNNKSTYSAKKEANTNGYSWRKTKYLLIRDHKKKTTNDWIEFLDNTYIVKDKLPKYRWKILNEIKEIEGYICMKAETIDTVKNRVIHAWFTDRIPFYAGPEGFGGLPGMILELDFDQGTCVVTATDVNLELADIDFPIPRKMKGKDINTVDLNAKIQKYIATSMEGEKNPYWRLRY